MKTFKLLLSLMIMVIAALSFTACEKDDTDFSSIINSSTTVDDHDDDNSDENDNDDNDDSGTSSNISYAVSVVYDATSATVTVAEDVASYLTVTKSGAHVSITQSSSLPDEVTYTLSGSSSDGSFYMDGELKATVVLNGLTLTSTKGAAINIENGKRIEVVLADGTTNSLTDNSSGTQKGAMMINGHTEFSGGGTLNLTGKTKHAFWGDEYVVFKKSLGTINVLSAVTDGFNVNQYIEMNGGTISIKSVGDEGIQASIEDGSESYDDGSFFMNGGTLTIATTDGKGIKAEGDIEINDGELSINASGSEGMEAGSLITINGGKVFVQSYDDAINSGSHMTINGGYIMAYSSNNDGIDSNGNTYIEGGNIFAISKSSPEVAIDANTEGGYKLYISGGNVVAIGGLESGASISGGTAYQTSSFSKGSWYGLYNSDSSLAFAYQVPNNNNMGSPMVVYTTGTTSLKSGVTGSGDSFWNGYGYTACSGGSAVTLSAYTGGAGMGGGGFSGGGPGGH